MNKKTFILLFVSLILSSCSFYNRMTSPETLKKEERVWTIGAVSDPQYFTDPNTKIYAIQPVVGYRSGLSNNQEIGVTLYGVWTPGVVFDYKHQICNWGNIYLTSDVAAYAGVGRPIGFQYDLLFGNRKLYGVLGTSYSFNNAPSHSAIVAGLGKEFGKDRRFGVQVSYTGSIETNSMNDNSYNAITIGLKVDLHKIKKKFRVGE